MRLTAFIFTIFTCSILLTSCEEVPNSPIESALFSEIEDDVENFVPPTFRYILTFDQNRNGNLEWGETIGFDFIVQNFGNTLPLNNVSVQIVGFNDSNFIREYDTEASSINFVSAGSSAQPSFSWCVDYAQSLLLSCTQPNDDYIGNFYFNLSFTDFGTQSLEVNFMISGTFDGNAFEIPYTQFLTVF